MTTFLQLILPQMASGIHLEIQVWTERRLSRRPQAQCDQTPTQPQLRAKRGIGNRKHGVILHGFQKAQPLKARRGHSRQN